MNSSLRFRAMARVVSKLGSKPALHQPSTKSSIHLKVHSILYCIQRFSSSSSGAILNNDDNSKHKDSKKKHIGSTPPAFPWRMNAITPLPRLENLDDLSGSPNNLRSRFQRKFMSAREMKTPLWDIFITRGWEKELAFNCSWAFQNALAAILSKFFGVPLSSIENNGSSVKLNLIGFPDNLARNSVSEKLESDEELEDEIIDLDQDDVARDAYLNAMVEENLVQYFMKNKFNDLEGPNTATEVSSSSETDPEKNRAFDILFYLEPIGSRLENIFFVPILTRDDVKQNESLRGGYQKIESCYRETGDVRLLVAKSRELITRVQDSVSKGLKGSIIMDISIDCLEKFYVKDRAEGKMLQGSESEKQVTHLVRFEMQTSKGDNSRDRELGSWIVIDVDDMLNGNVWH